MRKLRGVGVGLFVSTALAGCATATLALPRVGTQVPARVPLDNLWEIELSTPAKCGSLGGCPAPYSPRHVEVDCSPRDRCRASVAQSAANPRLILTVVGLREGPAVVSLRYQQPESDEWLSAKLSLEFLPERTLAPLALGQHVPAGPARFEHVADAFTAVGIRGPARCEPRDQYRETFICFGVDSSAGVPRFASCEHTPRCTGGGSAPFGGFVARVRSQGGVVTRIESSVESDGSTEATDVWEAPGDKDESP